MRANMRCTLVAWLSPGTTSAGQLNGNRPVSNTYSVTPHDLCTIGCKGSEFAAKMHMLYGAQWTPARRQLKQSCRACVLHRNVPEGGAAFVRCEGMLRV